MALKAQDVCVVLKLIADDAPRAPYSQLAGELGMSPSEVHASVKRLQRSGLLHGAELGNRANHSAVEEFLIHGLKYVFPAERGGLTRGVATSYGAFPLCELVGAGSDPIPVWPWPEGEQRGLSLSPLYKSAPLASLRDRSFYELLTLADALRDGRARERKLAATEMQRRLRGKLAQSKP